VKEYRLLCMRCNAEGQIETVRLRKDDMGINVILTGVCPVCAGTLLASSHVEYENVQNAFYMDERQGLLFVN